MYNKDKKMQNVEKSYVYIAHQIPSGACFGARSDSGEQVFIPASVAKASAAQEGITRETKMILNTHTSRDTTPWVAVYVAPDNGADNQEVFDAKLLREIEQAGYATTTELAAAVGSDGAAAQSSLMRLFRSGKIVKAEIYTKVRPAPPELCLWAVSIANFTE